jgi:hypothetical protein
MNTREYLDDGSDYVFSLRVEPKKGETTSKCLDRIEKEIREKIQGVVSVKSPVS